MIIVCPFDCNSRVPSHAGTDRIWPLLLRGLPFTSFDRSDGVIIPYLLENTVRNSRHSTDLVIGGDHSLTYFVLKGLCSRYGHINVVHFDAHHDSYQNSGLNNYTVFFHAARLLPISIYSVGYRYDTPHVSPVLEREVAGPVYISLDVDYFDPSIITQVGHAVHCERDAICNLATYESSINKIAGPVVGCDLVEWHGAPENSNEFNFIQKILHTLLRVIQR